MLKPIKASTLLIASALLSLPGVTVRGQSTGGSQGENWAAIWSTPGDGRLVMLARTVTSFSTPIPLRVRMCVTNFTGANNSVNLYIWTTANPWDQTPAAPLQQTRVLNLGDCVEIEQPAALILQDATITGTSSGYYEWLEPPKALPTSAASPGASSNVPKPHGHTIAVVNPQKQTAKCQPLYDPGQRPILSNDFLAKCQLKPPPYPNQKGVRICIGNNFVTWQKHDWPSPQQTNYAASLLDLIINKAFLPPINKPSPYDYNWNPVTPNGCRDVIGDPKDPTWLDNLYFMVGPNTAGGYWDATAVQSIAATTWSIIWSEAPIAQ